MNVLSMIIILVTFGGCAGAIVSDGLDDYKASRHTRKVIKVEKERLPVEFHCKIIAVDSE